MSLGNNVFYNNNLTINNNDEEINNLRGLASVSSHLDVHRR